MKQVITIITLFLLVGCTEVSTSQFSNTQAILDKTPASSVAVEVDNEPKGINQEDTQAEEIIVSDEKEQGQIGIIQEEPLGNNQIQIPKSFDQPVLFAPQAPFGIWDEVHQEACEEASMIMAARHFLNQNLDEQIMDEEIHKLVEWEEQNGFKIDLTANEAAKIIRDYYKLKANVVADISVEAIKKYLSDGKLIIIPAAGRLLGNPYFQTPGPIYHMLVIRGYDADEFVTNDPGTKRGEGFKYKYQTLINAIHDWDHNLAEGGMEDSEMNSGRKVIIVISQ